MIAKQCTQNAYGRLIERSQYAGLIEENRIRIEQNKVLYRRRQSIVEHPYGTIKRQWDFSYIMTKKTMERAAADVGLIFKPISLGESLIFFQKTNSKPIWKGFVPF